MLSTYCCLFYPRNPSLRNEIKCTTSFPQKHSRPERLGRILTKPQRETHYIDHLPTMRAIQILMVITYTFTATSALPFVPLLSKITIREVSLSRRPSATTGFPPREGTHGKRKDYFNFGNTPSDNGVDYPGRRADSLERGAPLKGRFFPFDAGYGTDGPHWSSTSNNPATETTSSAASESTSSATDVVTDDFSTMSTSSVALPTGIRTLPPTTAISSLALPEPYPVSTVSTSYPLWWPMSSTTASPMESSGCPFASEAEASLPVIVTVFASPPNPSQT